MVCVLSNIHRGRDGNATPETLAARMQRLDFLNCLLSFIVYIEQKVSCIQDARQMSMTLPQPYLSRKDTIFLKHLQPSGKDLD